MYTGHSNDRIDSRALSSVTRVFVMHIGLVRMRAAQCLKRDAKAVRPSPSYHVIVSRLWRLYRPRAFFPSPFTTVGHSRSASQDLICVCYTVYARVNPVRASAKH